MQNYDDVTAFTLKFQRYTNADLNISLYVCVLL